ncbi:IS3 family transposase [Streptomyces hypolithicus]
MIKPSFPALTYGYRRIHAQLHRWGITAGLELVRRLMRELGLEPCQPKPRRFGLTQGTPGSGAGPRRPQLHRPSARGKACRRYYLHTDR